MGRFLEFFLSSYTSETLEERNKVKYFVIATVLGLVFTVLCAALLLLLKDPKFLPAVIALGVTAVVSLLSLAFIKLRHYYVANTFMTVFLSLAVCFTFLNFQESPIPGIFRAAVTNLLVLVFITLISVRKLQTVLFGVLSVSGQIFIYLYKIQTGAWKLSDAVTVELFLIGFFLAFAAVFATLIMHQVEESISISRRELRILAEERNKLRRRNEMIEQDLTMARQIQMQFVPVRSPHENIAFYYKSMDMVGGDFYDFIEFPNTRKIGIFLSDVSGHGVPAAFITSMIKSALVQVAPAIDNPAYLLMYLNRSLVRHTSGNFVTAFYGIYDPDTREFVYANAGHNQPYIILNAESARPFIRLLTAEKSGIPLAVLPYDDFKTLDREYTNRSVTLQRNTKLFLYTDGLVEAVNLEDKLRRDNTPDFETAGFEKAVDELRQLPSRAFIGKLVDRLVEFRGADSFDDDVCIICVDVV